MSLFAELKRRNVFRVAVFYLVTTLQGSLLATSRHSETTEACY